jgi:hypothetical protein
MLNREDFLEQRTQAAKSTAAKPLRMDAAISTAACTRSAGAREVARASSGSGRATTTRSNSVMRALSNRY